MKETTERRSRHWLPLLAALLALVLAAAACGSDDGAAVDSTDETTAETSDTTVGADDATDDTTEDTTDAMSDDESAAASGLLGELQAAGTVKIGLANEVPYGYETEDGSIEGEAPDVAREVLAELGIDNVEAEVVDFGALISGLQAGQYDIIAAGMYITPERAEQIIFSDPDYCTTYAFAVPAGNPMEIGGGFDSIVDSGAKLAVLSGAVDETYASDAAVPDDQIELFTDVNAQYDALLAGRVDAVGGTALTVNNQVDASGGALEATDSFLPLDADGNEVYGCGGYGFIDQDFRDAFNEVLRQKLDDGTVETIATSYGFSAEDVSTAASLTVADLATE